MESGLVARVDRLGAVSVPECAAISAWGMTPRIRSVARNSREGAARESGLGCPDRRGEAATRRGKRDAGRAQVDVHWTSAHRSAQQDARCDEVRGVSGLLFGAEPRRQYSGVEVDAAVLEHGGDLDLAAELGDDRSEQLEREADLAVFELGDG